MLYLSRMIVNAHKKGEFISCLVYGQQGIGKTSYALHVAREIYNGWKYVLSYLFFNPLEAVNFLEQYLEEDKRIPLVIMDDAGLWLSKSAWWEKHKQVFAEFYDIIRTVCTCVIFTTPSDNLIKRLSKSIWLRAKIGAPQNLEGNFNPVRDAAAFLYRLYLSPLFQERVTKVAIDVYPRHYPDWVKERYDRKRKIAVKEKVKEFKDEYAKEIILRRDVLHKRIIELYQKGLSKAEIARRLGVARKTIYNHLQKEGVLG